MDFDAVLARIGERADALRAEMASALDTWLDATAPWAVDFWERSIAETVREEPGAVIGMRQEALRRIKEEAAELMAHARSHLQRRLVDERREDWPHLKPQIDPHDRAFRRDVAHGPFDVLPATRPGSPGSPPELVAGRLSGVLGDIASISARNGLTLTGFKRGDPYGHSGEWHADKEHGPPWSHTMLECMATYAALHARYVEILSDCASISAEKQKAEASRLWETA